MKVIKKILLVIISLIILILIIAAFVPKQYAVEREIEINKSKTEIFEYVKFLRNQDNYSVWAKRDPNMKKEFQGTDGTVGFVSAWDSDNKDVGKGEQEILSVVEGERIDFELRFIEPFEAKDLAYMVTESLSDSLTVVKWGFSGEISYPMNLMLLFMNMEEMLGGDLQNGLANLKGILED
ncbi:MAG: SRPBCC family protein [Bacteroidales bacterium]|jgi:hypothetical protein|nr:SRPBCC family protein [Bacteroidales bacterium]